MRGAIGTVVAALLALGICVASASADPLSMSFTEGRVNAGSQLSDAAVIEPPNTAPLSAQIDPESGAITEGSLPVASVSAPITEPIETVATLEFAVGAITGSFTESTGALTLSGLAAGTLTAAGSECTVSTNPPTLIFSTAGSSGGANPRSGAPFTEGLAGPGEIATQWNDMSASPVTPNFNDFLVCAAFDSRIGGPGGAWLRQGEPIAPPPPGPPPPGGSGSGGSGGSGGTGSGGSGSGGAGDSGTSGASPARPGANSTPTPTCVVPNLSGKTLSRAKAALTNAHCKLGAVHKPKSTKGALIVKSSSPATGAKPPSGEVDLKLGPKLKSREHGQGFYLHETAD